MGIEYTWRISVSMRIVVCVGAPTLDQPNPAATYAIWAKRSPRDWRRATGSLLNTRRSWYSESGQPLAAIGVAATPAPAISRCDSSRAGRPRGRVATRRDQAARGTVAPGTGCPRGSTTLTTTSSGKPCPARPI